MKRSQLMFALAGWVAFLVAVLPTTEPTATAGGRGGPAGTIGCEADIAPPGGNGVVDVVDLLLLLAQWGACVDCSGAGEPNDDCGSSFTLPTVESSGANQTRMWSGSALEAGDVDLFRFVADETDATCSCCDQFCLDEDYLVEVSLTVPGDATGSYLFRVDANCSTSTAGAVAVPPGLTDTISFWVDGDCGGADTYTRFILVTGANATVASCTPYTLTYSFTPGCQ